MQSNELLQFQKIKIMMKGRDKHILNLIEGQENLIKSQEAKIEKARIRIIELKEELFDLQNMKTLPVAPAASTDNHDYCGKILYPSKKAADSARRLINRDLAKVGKPAMKRSYFCQRCEAWHLTTMPNYIPFPENENAAVL